MTPSEKYRKKAAEFAVMARGETKPALHMEYARMARHYLRLAVLADRNTEAERKFASAAPQSKNSLNDGDHA